MNNTKLSEKNPKLSYHDLCMVFKTCYPTISDGIYSIENSVLSDIQKISKNSKKRHVDATKKYKNSKQKYKN